MPLYQEWSPNEHSLAAIWHIKEDEAFFSRQAGVSELDVRHIRHPRRRVEHLAGRHLLQHLKEDFPLLHIAADEHDKPRLPANRYYFSISHSHPYVAAVISDREDCGIDIQVWHKRMESIAHMFLSPEERVYCRDDERLMTLAWSAKEAAYKWNGRRGADFIRDLPIHYIEELVYNLNGENQTRAYSVEMDCFDQKISPTSLIYNDFALACLIRERIHSNKL